MRFDTAESAGLQTIVQREALVLAPYAMRSADSRGRKHPEAEHAYRGPFQRDRDRVVHSAAYRRLSGKMQVFTGDMGDYHRTRLTHTYEVASIARTMGRALRLNEDLIEALALFHDIGHPPFGHAGEETLNDCLADHGGFSHNRYALTIAEELEVRYHAFPGLNLTREVLEGQAVRALKNDPETCPLLEVQIVDLADSITYDAHDTDDAIKLGLVTLDQIAETPLARETVATVQSRYGTLPADMARKAVVHELIDVQVGDVLRTAGDQLARYAFQSADQARKSSLRLAPSPVMLEKKLQLEDYLYAHVYRHPRIVAVRRRAQHRLRVLFRAFCEHPDRLPDKFQRRIEMVGIQRSVADYLAGMTDRFCEHQYRRIAAGRDVG